MQFIPEFNYECVTTSLPRDFFESWEYCISIFAGKTEIFYSQSRVTIVTSKISMKKWDFDINIDKWDFNINIVKSKIPFSLNKRDNLSLLIPNFSLFLEENISLYISVDRRFII